MRRKPLLKLSQQALDGDGRRWKSPLDVAVYLLSKTVSFVSAFIIVSTGKPKNVSKWVLIGPKPIKSMLF